MTKINLHTNNNTTGGVFFISPMLPRTTIIADSVHSGLAFFMLKILSSKGSFNNCLSVLSLTDEIKVDMTKPLRYTIYRSESHTSTVDMKPEMDISNFALPVLGQNCFEISE